MYLERLTTPNEIRYPQQPAQQLVEVLGLENTAEQIRAAPDSWEATIQTIDKTRHEVRRALHYPTDDTDSDWAYRQGEMPLNTLTSPSQQTNCIGYSLVASEALRRAQIQHYVAYGRGHWLLLVPQAVNGGARLHTLDFLLPEFSTDVTDDVSFHMRSRPPKGTPKRVEQLEKSLKEHPERQQNMVLHSDAIAANIGIAPQQLAEEYPAFWGDPKGVVYSVTGPETCSPIERRLRNQLKWVMSVYTPETGQTVLERHAGFTSAMGADDFTVAAEQVLELDGRFPENDCRYSHHEIRRLIGGICLNGSQVGLASDTIEAYCNSIQTGDARVFELKGDLYREIVRKTQDGTAALRSINAYDQARANTTTDGRTYREACSGKASKVAIQTSRSSHHGRDS